MTFYREAERIHRCGWFYPKKQVGMRVWILRIFAVLILLSFLFGCTPTQQKVGKALVYATEEYVKATEPQRRRAAIQKKRLQIQQMKSQMKFEAEQAFKKSHGKDISRVLKVFGPPSEIVSDSKDGLIYIWYEGNETVTMENMFFVNSENIIYHTLVKIN